MRNKRDLLNLIKANFVSRMKLRLLSDRTSPLSGELCYIVCLMLAEAGSVWDVGQGGLKLCLPLALSNHFDKHILCLLPVSCFKEGEYEVLLSTCMAVMYR